MAQINQFMNKLMKRGAYMLLVACLSAGMVGCDDDDPNYDNVTPPTVEVAPNTLTGVITGMDGTAISGAKVSMGDASATTDANGIYLFDDVKAGTYQMKAEAEGKLSQEGTLTVADEKKSQNLVWNATLAADVKKEVAVSADAASEGTVETETLKNNDAAKVEVKAEIAAGAVEVEEGEEVTVTVAPIYREENALYRSASRASDATMLVGANLSCSKENASLKKAIDLGFELDAELAGQVEAKQYKNGAWVAVDSRIEDGRVIVSAGEFASYGLFLGVSFSEAKSSEAISFNPNKWDNLYGASDMTVGDAAYTYKVGTEIGTQGTNKLTALLVEKLAQRFGATVTTVNGSYPINVTLPVGTMMEISGFQTKWSVSASAFGRTATGTRYGNVTVAVVTANRQHTGGTGGTN